MALGLTLEQLIGVYRVMFSVSRDYDRDTWYDSLGRVVFTNNRGLFDVGFDRAKWEKIKDEKSGVFFREVIDDTKPFGPIKRVIEYRAPFDRSDREIDYQIVWDFFASIGR
jgi:hypothetical protein